MINEQTSVQSLLDIISKKSAEKNVEELANYLQSILEEAGIEVKIKGNATAGKQIIATLKGETAGKVIGYSASIDLAANEEERASNESALLAAILSMVRMKKSNDPFKGTLKLLVIIGEGLKQMGCEQFTRDDFARNLDALVVCQPAPGGLAIAEKGKLWLQFSNKGVGTHGSTPSNGVNAIDHSLALLDAFYGAIDFSQYEDEVLGKSTCSFNTFNGGSAPGTIPDLCVAGLDIRTVSAQEHEDIHTKISEINLRLTQEIEKFELTVIIVEEQLPVVTDPDNALVQLAVGIVKQITGVQDQPAVTNSAEMGRFVDDEEPIPAIILGPKVLNGVYLQGDDQLIDIYGELAHQFLQ